MTTYNIYCDESRHTSDPQDRFAVIGALQCPRDAKYELVGRLHKLQALHNAHGEAGWKRISPNRIEFYQDLLELFINDDSLNFRCIVIDRSTLDHERFNDGDAELGFYKLYYQLLVHWLHPKNSYHLYLDWQQNSASRRFVDLQTILVRKLKGRASIESLEPVYSHNQPLIQLCDILTGAVGYQWNGYDSRTNASEAKANFCNRLASSLNRTTLAAGTTKGESKFNIFNWQGRL